MSVGQCSVYGWDSVQDVGGTVFSVSVDSVQGVGGTVCKVTGGTVQWARCL